MKLKKEWAKHKRNDLKNPFNEMRKLQSKRYKKSNNNKKIYPNLSKLEMLAKVFHFGEQIARREFTGFRFSQRNIKVG